MSNPVLIEEIANQIMKERGYSNTGKAESGKKTILLYAKEIKSADCWIHANVTLESDQLELTFSELTYCIKLSTDKFDFWCKDYVSREAMFLTYIAKCLDKNTTEIFKEVLNSFSFGSKKEREPVQKDDIKTRKRKFWDKIVEYGKEKGYTKEMCLSFYNYWIEMNDGGKKMRWEIEKTRSGVFDVKGRLRTWKSNESKFNKPKTFVEQKIQNQNKETVAKTIKTKELF